MIFVEAAAFPVLPLPTESHYLQVPPHLPPGLHHHLTSVPTNRIQDLN